MNRRSRPRIPSVPGRRVHHPASALDTSGCGRTEPTIASGSRLAPLRKRVTRGRSVGMAGRTGICLAPTELQEVLVEAAIVRELGMERRREEPALPGGDDRRPFAIERGEDLHLWSDALDERRADEDRVERLRAEDGHVEVRFE